MRVGRRVAAALLATLVLAPLASAQRDTPIDADSLSESIQDLFNSIWVPQSRFVNSPHVRAAFRPVVNDVRRATVEVRAKGRRVAYGGVVGPDGWVVTKASLVRSAVTCRLRDGRELDARLVGVDPETDLAMLKIAAKDLSVLDLTLGVSPTDEAAREVSIPTSSEEPEPSIDEPGDSVASLMAGDWVASVGLGRDPFAVGVVSVLPRPIEKRDGFLGVRLDIEYVPPDDAANGVMIEEVTPGKAAADAGILAGDLIVAVEGRPTPTPRALKEAIASKNPGDRVEIDLVRGEETLRVLATLQFRTPDARNLSERRALYQNQPRRRTQRPPVRLPGCPAARHRAGTRRVWRANC